MLTRFSDEVREGYVVKIIREGALFNVLYDENSGGMGSKGFYVSKLGELKIGSKVRVTISGGGKVKEIKTLPRRVFGVISSIHGVAVEYKPSGEKFKRGVFHISHLPDAKIGDGISLMYNRNLELLKVERY
jgi:hypothetical protein